MANKVTTGECDEVARKPTKTILCSMVRDNEEIGCFKVEAKTMDDFTRFMGNLGFHRNYRDNGYSYPTPAFQHNSIIGLKVETDEENEMVIQERVKSW